MNDLHLRHELNRVGGRYRLLARRSLQAAGWLILALVALAVLKWLRAQDYAPALIAAAIVAGLALLCLPLLVIALRRTRQPLWLARRIETRFPDLDARLLAALEQHTSDSDTGELGFLQQSVIDQSVVHARRNEWTRLVPTSGLRMARLATWGLFLAFAGVMISVGIELRHGFAKTKAGIMQAARLENFDIKIEPADTSIERNTALLVMARFGNTRIPGEVELLYREPDGEVQQMSMSRSLDDPLFAGRVAPVKRDLSYAVKYGSEQSRWFKVNVFDYPQLRQADAKLKYPEYTGLDEKVVQDTRSITAVEGTKATVTFHLNKPVTDARLVPTKRAATTADTADTAAAPQASPVVPAAPIALIPDPSDPTKYTAALDLKQSQLYAIQLVDADRRANRDQAQLAVNVVPNKPAELKLQWPARDLDVSALEEVTVRAQVYDDFGVKRVGMTYYMAGQSPQDVMLADNVAGKDRKDVSQTIALEKLSAQPDQLLSYNLWAEDVGPDGKVRRTLGDMFFADVRPFEEIYRQGQQPAGGDQQGQQQQRQQGQNGQNAQRAENVAETIKQIIAATWKVIRRENSEPLTAQFVPDVKLLQESLSSAKEQASAMSEQLADERSRSYLQSASDDIDKAISQLKEAESGPKAAPLTGALASEQAAYQDLLKLRAREFEVTRSRQQGQRGQSTASARRQRQMNQMDLQNQDNPYQNQRTASPDQQQQQQDASRETRQVLSRLRELAQRQEDLNRQMRELQSSLEAARDQAQREELQRQLARLRDQQQQQLRDTDELRDRMDQPQNQESMADARQQLEDTRNNVQRASQELQNGQVQQAAAAGQRASEQLNNLQDQVRRAAAGQFGEAMNQMRQDARQLDQNEQQLAQRLGDLNNQQSQRNAATPATPGLRDTNTPQDPTQQRRQVAQDLQQQRQQLQRLLDNMRQTVEQAETPEPVLSRQLYDTLRQQQQQAPERALDSTQQLVQQGLLQEARQAENEAGRGITRVREGVEQAAASILGDETDSLRRARAELDALAQQLDREMGRAGAASRPTTGPAGERMIAAGTQPTTEPATRPGAGTQLAQNDQAGRRGGAARGGQRGGQQARGGQQPGEAQDPQLAQARGAGLRPTQDNQPGGRQGGQRGGQQARGGQQPGRGDQGQQARGGQQPGRGDQAQQGNQGQQGDQPGEAQLAQGDQPQDAAGGAPGGRGGQRGGARGGGLRPQNNEGPQIARGAANEYNGGRDFVFSGDPITGDGYRVWADGLRDIEEIVGDPRLRAQAAQIRQRAAELRAEYRRHSEAPNWNVVQDTLSKPLAELRNAVAQELLRRESAQALVPIDKEPVPPDYAEQVRRYYERLGSGK